MVDIVNSMNDDTYFLYDRCPPDYMQDQFGNCQPLVGGGTGSLVTNIFPPNPPTPPIPPIPEPIIDPIINPNLFEDEESATIALPNTEQETIIVPVENTITIYSDDGKSLTITEAEAISAGIITAGGIMVKYGTDAYNSYQVYQEGLAKRAAEEEGIEMAEEGEARAIMEGEGELMVEEEGQFAFEEGAEYRYAYEEPTEGLFEDDVLLEGEEGVELIEAGETAETIEGAGELFEGGEAIFEGGETAIEMAEIGEETALLAEEGTLATELALETAGFGAEIIGAESIALIGAEAAAVAPYAAPIIIVGTAIAVLGYVLYSIFGKRKKKKKTKTETTYEEETIDVPITYEEMVSELQPDERKELLEAMKANNDNGQFDSSIEKLETGQKIILSTYADGSQALTFPLNTTQLEGLPKFLEQNPEYFYGMDNLYLQSLGVNPDLADPNLAPSIIEDGNIYSIVGQETIKYVDYAEKIEDQDAVLLGEWSAKLSEADYLYANRMITLEEYNELRAEAMAELDKTVSSEAEKEKLINVIDYQAGRITADEYIDNMRTNTFIYESPEWTAWLNTVQTLHQMYLDGDITGAEYDDMIKTNKQAFIDAEPTTLTQYEYDRLTIGFQYDLGQLTYDEYLQALDYTYALEVTDYSQFSERLIEEEDDEVIDNDYTAEEQENMREELTNNNEGQDDKPTLNLGDSGINIF